MWQRFDVLPKHGKHTSLNQTVSTKVLMMNVLDDCPKLEQYTMHTVICKLMMQPLDGKARRGRERGQCGELGVASRLACLNVS